MRPHEINGKPWLKSNHRSIHDLSNRWLKSNLSIAQTLQDPVKLPMLCTGLLPFNHTSWFIRARTHPNLGQPMGRPGRTLSNVSEYHGGRFLGWTKHWGWYWWSNCFLLGGFERLLVSSDYWWFWTSLSFCVRIDCWLFPVFFYWWFASVIETTRSKTKQNSGSRNLRTSSAAVSGVMDPESGEGNLKVRDICVKSISTAFRKRLLLYHWHPKPLVLGAISHIWDG